MKQPELRETTDRGEMMCPRCETEGLEENPAYKDEYKGRSALIKATRCPNESCQYNYGLPEDEVRIQLPDEKFGNIPNLLPSELTVGTMVRGGVLILGILFMLLQFGLLPFGSDTTQPTDDVLSNIEGEITGDDLEGLSNISLQLDNINNEESYSLNPDNNNFNFTEIPTGEYVLYLSSPDLRINPSGQFINVTDSNSENVTINVIDNEPYNINQTIENAMIIIDHQNPNNINDIDLTLSPIEGDNIEREHTIESGVTDTILMPITPQSEQIRVNSSETKQEQIINSQYINEEQTYNISGNMNAENINITLTDESTSDVQSRTVNVPASGLNEEISIASEETVGPVTLTLRDGTSQERQQKTGTWSGGENITFLTGVDSTTTGNLQISPSPITDSEIIMGTISQNIIQPNLEGNMPINDAVIEFKGGDSDSEEIGEAFIDVDAENGSTGQKEEKLVTIEESGTYRLNWEANVFDNSNLVEFSYIINGEEHTIEEGDDGEGLTLDSDDIIEISAEANRETVSNDENSPHFGSLDENINIVDVYFESSNPDPGENIELFATIENEANHDITEEFVFYFNGDEEISRSYTIPANSQKEIGGLNELGTTSVSEEGTNVWFVNDRGPFFIEVGNSEPVYGVGEISATIQDLSSEGEVGVDTNNDGNINCRVLASGGECEFEHEFNPNDIDDILIEEISVSNTEYELSYTKQTNPEDIRIDMRENNITDYSYDGILTQTDSDIVEVPSGDLGIGFEVGNNVPIEYSLTWDAEAVINNPVIYVNGDEKISDLGSFQEEQSFEIEPLPQGNNQFEFLSSSGGYTVDIEWIEDEGQSYPETLINGQPVCDSGDAYANNLTCVITDSGVSPGEHTIGFDTTNTFNYQLSYNSKAVSSSVDVQINEDNIQFNRDSAEPMAWEDVSSTSLLSRGENNITIDVPDENNMTPISEAIIQYSINTGDVENPELIVTNGDGETNQIDIPESAITNNVLTEETNVTIPENWLTINDNEINIRTEDGVFELQGEINVTEDNITFESN